MNVYTLQIFFVTTRAIDIPIQVRLKSSRTLRGFQILSQMRLIMFVQRTEAAGMGTKWHMGDNIHINSREEGIVYSLSLCEFILNNFFSGHDHPPSCSRHHQIIAAARGDCITPPIRLEGMKDC